MTSLELVDFINQHREEKAKEAGLPFPCGQYTRLVHHNFMVKVPKVLGAGLAPKFLGCNVYENGKGGTQIRDVYVLPKRESCLMAMSYSYELQAAVFDHMTMLEAKLAQPATLPSYAETLRLYADQIEQTQRVTHERDYAVATKAEIGNRREATAMATASAAVREASRLKAELGRNAQAATIIAVEKACSLSFGKQGFRPLQKWCKSKGITPIKVPCPRYGEAAAWPAQAWFDCYNIDLGEVFGGEV